MADPGSWSGYCGNVPTQAVFTPISNVSASWGPWSLAVLVAGCTPTAWLLVWLLEDRLFSVPPGPRMRDWMKAVLSQMHHCFPGGQGTYRCSLLVSTRGAVGAQWSSWGPDPGESRCFPHPLPLSLWNISDMHTAGRIISRIPCAHRAAHDTGFLTVVTVGRTVGQLSLYRAHGRPALSRQMLSA